MISTLKNIIKGSPYRGLKKEDIVLASFPKTGNTFTRFVLANFIAINARAGEEVNFYNLGNLLPEFGKDDLRLDWQQKVLPRVVKTHEAHRNDFDEAERFLYVMRDPRDTMISYFKYLQANKKVQFSGDIDAFMRDPKYGLEVYLDHIASWKSKANWVFRYEDLMSKPYPLFAQFLNDLGCEFEPEELEEAISRSQPDRMRKVESAQGRPAQDKNFKEGYVFVRNASTEQWKDFYSAEQLQFFKEKCGETLGEFKYTL